MHHVSSIYQRAINNLTAKVVNDNNSDVGASQDSHSVSTVEIQDQPLRIIDRRLRVAQVLRLLALVQKLEFRAMIPHEASSPALVAQQVSSKINMNDKPHDSTESFADVCVAQLKID